MTRAHPYANPLALSLARADQWVVTLAGFLARGGLLLFLVPIVAVPSPLDLADVLGPAVTTAALGGPDPDLIRLVVIASVGATLIVVAAFLIGAATDVGSVLAEARALGRPEVEAPRNAISRAFVARLLAHLPVVAVLAATIPVIVGATYHELILPDELVTPLVLRVMRDIPIVVVALVVALVVGEVVGGLAVRAIVLEGRGIPRGLVRGVVLLVVHPIASLVALVGGTVAIVVLLAPALLASAVVWRWATLALTSGPDPVRALLASIALAGLWIGGLLLAGFATALRSLLWTVVALRR